MREQGREQSLDAAFRAVAKEDAGDRRICRRSKRGCSPKCDRSPRHVDGVCRMAALGIAAALLLAVDGACLADARPPACHQLASAREVTTEFLPLALQRRPRHPRADGQVGGTRRRRWRRSGSRLSKRWIARPPAPCWRTCW